MELDNKSAETQGAVQHLEAALEADQMDDADYHVRQALQLLGVE